LKTKNEIYIYIKKENHLDLLMVVNHLQVNIEYSNEVPNVFLMLVQHNYSHVGQIFSKRKYPQKKRDSKTVKLL
jgi:hypothetical protein